MFTLLKNILFGHLIFCTNSLYLEAWYIKKPQNPLKIGLQTDLCPQKELLATLCGSMEQKSRACQELMTYVLDAKAISREYKVYVRNLPDALLINKLDL